VQRSCYPDRPDSPSTDLTLIAVGQAGQGKGSAVRNFLIWCRRIIVESSNRRHDVVNLLLVVVHVVGYFMVVQ
jgi:hypothetical protein